MLLASTGLCSTSPLTVRQGMRPKGPDCQTLTFAGEVAARSTYRRRIDAKLEFVLEPVASGWIIRVLPLSGPRPPHDYAEVATPPYNSVTPLSITTDFALRSQDAIGWNPRDFHFAADRTSYLRLLAFYQRSTVSGSLRGGTPTGGEIAEALRASGAGTLTIVDAHLEAGTADQSAAGAAVASHFNSTAHALMPPGSHIPTALGQLLWLRFQVNLRWPGSGHTNPSTSPTEDACL